MKEWVDGFGIPLEVGQRVCYVISDGSRRRNVYGRISRITPTSIGVYAQRWGKSVTKTTLKDPHIFVDRDAEVWDTNKVEQWAEENNA